MSLRKYLVLSVVVLLNSLAVPITYADISMQNAVTQMITYLTSATTIRNQADATLIYMDSPGTTATAQNVGATAGFVESTLRSILLPKEITDLDWSLYTVAPAGVQTAGNVYSTFYKNHMNSYCSPSSGVEICKNSSGQADQYGDLKISSLLEPSIYDSNSSPLAAAVITNLTTPFPDTNLGDAISSSSSLSATNIQYAATVMSKQAVISAARNSLNESYAARMPNVIPGSNPQQISSIMSVMENESGRRFKNQAWYNAVQQSSQEALLRELVQMEAYRLWMDYYRYRQNERMETLLAVLTAQTTNMALQFQSSMSAAASAAESAMSDASASQ